MRRLSDETKALLIMVVIAGIFVGGCEAVQKEQAVNKAAADKIWSVSR